jgi:hypothetical protein
VSDEAAMFRPGVFYFEDPFVAELQLETFLERLLFVSSSSDRVSEGDFVLLIVEVQGLVDRVGKTVQTHQLEETELESLGLASINVVADLGPDLTSQISPLLSPVSSWETWEGDFHDATLIN